MGIFGGFIEKQERKVVAGQMDTVAEQIRTGRFKSMNPKIVKYLEGLAWAGVSAAWPSIVQSFQDGHLSSGDWRAALALFITGGAAYLRVHKLDEPDAPVSTPEVK